MAKTGKGFSVKQRGKAKQRDAEGHSYKRKDNNIIKTKAKTANRNINTRQQRVAMAKPTHKQMKM